MIRDRIVSLCAASLLSALLICLPSPAQSDGNVGCLFSEQVCTEGEACFDDLVIGRCILAGRNEIQPVRLGPLSGPPLDLLAAEMKRVSSQGYTWEDDYSQCVFQTLLNHIEHQEFYSADECSNLAVNNGQTDNDENSDETAEDDDIFLEDDVPSSYKSYHDTDFPYLQGATEDLPSEAAYSLPEILPVFPSSLLTPNPSLQDLPPYQPLEPELQDQFIEDLLAQTPGLNLQPDQTLQFVDQFSPEEEQGVSFVDPVSQLADTHTPEEISYVSSLLQNLPNENAFFLDEDTDQEVPEVLVPGQLAENPVSYVPDQLVEDEDQLYLPNDLSHQPFQNPQESRNKRLSTTFDDLDANDVNENLSTYDFDYNDSSAREEGDNDDAIYYSDDDRIPMETIFDRRERLDVKKPGPFFANSQNNFFLNKLLALESDESPDEFSSSEELGQTEYELPLTMQNKQKKSSQIGALLGYEDPPSADSSLVVNIKGRFNTLGQALDIVDILAKCLEVPTQTFGEPKLWSSRLSIPVHSNPSNLNATSMAKVLGEKLEMVNQKLVEGKSGLEIQSFSTTTQQEDDDYVVSVFTGHSRLFFALFFLTAGLASVLVMGGLILILRRRRSKKVEEKTVLTEDKDEPVKEYKQLVRDWSRSSRASQGSGTGNGAGPEDGAKDRSSGEDVSKRQPLCGLPGKQQNSEGSRNSSTSSWQEEPGVSTMDISTGHMVLAYMEDHLNNKQRLEQEWVGLCAYEAEPAATSVAFKTENKKKNRFPDKLPYDHNRVLLNALVNGSNSDYINASSVTDHDPRNPAYIVTQGPMAHTIADFWQMVWEQGSVVIVMLSRLTENGYQLVHRYWPEEGSNQYHIYEVHLVSEHVWCEDYLVRSLYLKNTQTGETRTVTQFHFLSWPDACTPTSTKFLLEFRRKVNKSYRGRSCPIIIHCSDGVGRSGTYVLIDMALNRINKGSKEIDIAATLEHIRDQRSGMVQTRSQFEFCLTAIAEETHAILKSLAQ